MNEQEQQQQQSLLRASRAMATLARTDAAAGERNTRRNKLLERMEGLCTQMQAQCLDVGKRRAFLTQQKKDLDANQRRVEQRLDEMTSLYAETLRDREETRNAHVDDTTGAHASLMAGSSRITKLLEDISQKINTNSQVRQEPDVLKDRFLEASTQFAVQQRRLTTQVEDLESRTRDYKRKSDDLADALSAQEKSNKALDAARLALENKAGRLTDEVGKLQKEKRDLKNNLEDAVAAGESQLVRHGKDLSSLRARIARRDQSLNEACQRLSDNEESSSLALEAARKMHAEELASLRTQFADREKQLQEAHNQELKSLREQLAEKDEKLKEALVASSSSNEKALTSVTTNVKKVHSDILLLRQDLLGGASQSGPVEERLLKAVAQVAAKAASEASAATAQQIDESIERHTDAVKEFLSAENLCIQIEDLQAQLERRDDTVRALRNEQARLLKRMRETGESSQWGGAEEEDGSDLGRSRKRIKK